MQPRTTAKPWAGLGLEDGTSLGVSWGSSPESPEAALDLQSPAPARVLAKGRHHSHVRSLMMQEVQSVPNQLFIIPVAHRAPPPAPVIYVLHKSERILEQQ